ncbi:hypothetical protein, partial [Desulfofundulus sp.]|uniref:hypothetical protein n=1 Tax=Desulfofundulus sp. TaxID=2282750 RepID=UPI003C728602
MVYRNLVVRVQVISPVLVPLRARQYPLCFDALVIALLAARRGSPAAFRYDPARDVEYLPENGPRNGVPLAVVGDRRPV